MPCAVEVNHLKRLHPEAEYSDASDAEGRYELHFPFPQDGEEWMRGALDPATGRGPWSIPDYAAPLKFDL